jgi:hypothetical protein
MQGKLNSPSKNFLISENGYAANGIKHCIRPQDMTGKSAAMILRQMHPFVV